MYTQLRLNVKLSLSAFVRLYCVSVFVSLSTYLSIYLYTSVCPFFHLSVYIYGCIWACICLCLTKSVYLDPSFQPLFVSVFFYLWVCVYLPMVPLATACLSVCLCTSLYVCLPVCQCLAIAICFITCIFCQISVGVLVHVCLCQHLPMSMSVSLFVCLRGWSRWMFVELTVKHCASWGTNWVFVMADSRIRCSLNCQLPFVIPVIINSASRSKKALEFSFKANTLARQHKITWCFVATELVQITKSRFNHD